MKLKKLFKHVTAQNNIKPELQMIRVKDGFIYATDGYKMIKAPTDGKSRFIVHGDGFLMEDMAKVVDARTKKRSAPEYATIDTDEYQYPDCDTVINTLTNKTALCTFSISQQSLLDFVSAMRDAERDFIGCDKFTVTVYDNSLRFNDQYGAEGHIMLSR